MANQEGGKAETALRKTIVVAELANGGSQRACRISGMQPNGEAPCAPRMPSWGDADGQQQTGSAHGSPHISGAS